MPVVTMKQLLEAGVHFGHQTRRWNPKMASFIFTERNGIHIIDLQKSVPLIEEAYRFVRDAVAQGGDILFVGNVGEEGLGDLRGIKHLMLKGQYKDRIKHVIAVDGAGEGGSIVTAASAASGTA